MLKMMISLLIIGGIMGNVMAYEEFIPDTEKKVNQLADAIYLAEGGAKTRFPYGIKSIPCEDEEQCRRYCKNTIRNNVRRWRAAISKGDKRDYLTFLWHRYCPPKAHTLNVNWKRNVSAFLFDL